MSHDNTDEPLPGEEELKRLARSLTVADLHLETPPPGLFAGIQALVAAGQPQPESAAPATPEAPEAPAAGNHPWRAATRSRRASVLLAAAAAVAVMVVGAAVFSRSGGDDSVAMGRAALTNDGLDSSGSTSAAAATLVALPGGQLALELSVDNLPSPSDGFLELWIIDTEVAGMYSLGPLHGSGRYVLPAHVDPADFPVVDISVEPTDGAPAHSGVSILRGQLDLAG